MADFTLEAGLQAATGDIDRLIQEVQKGFDKQLIAVKFDRDSIVELISDVQAAFDKNTIKLDLDIGGSGGASGAKSAIKSISTLLGDIEKLTVDNKASGSFAGTIKAYNDQIKMLASSLSGLVHIGKRSNLASVAGTIKAQLTNAFKTGDPFKIKQTFDDLTAAYGKIPGLTKKTQDLILNEFAIGYEKRKELQNNEFNSIKTVIDKIAAYSKKYSKDGIVDSGNKEQQYKYLDDLAQRYQGLADIIKSVYSNSATFDEAGVRKALSNTNFTLEQQEAILKSIKNGWDGVHDAAVRANSDAQVKADRDSVKQQKDLYDDIARTMRSISGLQLKLVKVEDANVIAEINTQIDNLYQHLMDIGQQDIANALKTGDFTKFEAAVRASSLSLEQQDAIIKLYKDSLDKLTLTQKQHIAQQEKEREEAQKHVQTMNNAISVVKRYITTFLGFASVAQVLRSVYNNVVDLDKAVVDLQIATGYSREVVSDMVSDYADLGQQLGVSTVDITKAADSWLRQGYESKEATTLITASTMLAKLGQIDMAAATDYLTSSMKGYGLSVDSVINVVDKLTAVDLVSATSAGDLAEAMQKTAVTANQVGIPLDKLIGMIATISEVSQQSAQTVGTAMKSMLARLVNIKAGFLEDPETGENISNVEAALRGVGIALRDASGGFREMDLVLDEIASKWKIMTNIQQSAVAVALGGTRQQENVRILMEYWDQVGKLTKVAADSAGNAQTKFEAYSGGIEAKINALKAAWQNFSNTLLSSSAVKNIVEDLTRFVDILDKIPGSLLVISGILIKMSSGAFKTGMLQALGNGASYLGGAQAGFSSIGAMFSAMASKLGAFLPMLSSAVPYIAAIAGSLLLIRGILGWIQNTNKETDWGEKFEEASKAVEKNSAEIDENKKKLEDYNKSLEDGGKRLEELNKLKANGGVTVEQEQEIARIEIQNQKYQDQIKLLEERNKKLTEGLQKELKSQVDAYGKKSDDLLGDLTPEDTKIRNTLAIFGADDQSMQYVIEAGVEDYIKGLDTGNLTFDSSLSETVDLYNRIFAAASDESMSYLEEYGLDFDMALSYLRIRILDAISFYQESLAKAVELGDTSLEASINGQLDFLYNAIGYKNPNRDKPSSTPSESTYTYKEKYRHQDYRPNKAESYVANAIASSVYMGDAMDDAAFISLFPNFDQYVERLKGQYEGFSEFLADWANGVYKTSDDVYVALTKIFTPTNKEAFESVQAIVNAEWAVDKQAAVDSFGLIAERLGATAPQVAAMKDALMATEDKNTIIDSLITFFNAIGIDGVEELTVKLRGLKEAVEQPQKITIADSWSNFENAVKAFGSASDVDSKTKAIADMIDTLAKAHLDQDVFDEVLGHILDLKAGNIKLDEFKNIIFDLAQKYPEFARYADFDWKKVVPSANVKDTFSAIKNVLDADWSSDKDSAISKLAEVAAALGVDGTVISGMTEMLQNANLSTDKNSIIDMIVRFLQGSDIAGASELIEKLLQLKDATSQKIKSELFGDLSGVISGFTSNGSAFEKNQSAGSIASAARLFFGDQFFDDNNIQEWIDRLRLGEITLDDFKNKIWEISQGTFMSQFIPDSWKKELPDVNKQLQDLASSLNSLMSQGSDRQRKDAFDSIVKGMDEIADLAPEVKSALMSAMQDYLDSGDSDAFKSAIAEIFSGNPELKQYILDSWLPDVKKVKTEDAIKNIVSDINSLQKEDTQQGRDEYFKKISDALATLGITAENTAGTGLFDFLQALQAGTVDGKEFESQIYLIADALSKLLGIDINLRNFLPDLAKPETLESRLATAMGTPQQIMPQYSDTFNSAKDSLMGLGTGDMITSEEQAAILQQLPQLSDEFREYAAVVADSTATDIEKRIALENLKTAFMGLYGMDMAGEFRSSMEDLVDGMEDLDEGSLAYAEGIESIADAYGIATDTARDYFDELQAAVDGSTDAWAEFQKAATEDIFANVELQGEFNTDDLLAGLYTVQDVINATGWTSDELQEKLIANGLFEEVPNTITGKLKIPEFTVPGTGLHFPGLDVDASYDQPLLKPTEAFQGTAPKKHGGGGKKKSPKTGGKTSILSEQYTNDKGLYDTLIDNLKNLNNLYEEGSEEWLRNQQRIIETYQAYAKTIQDEYDRLVKAGVDMTDKEMQTLAKDLLKVNKEMYDAAKEYWEAVRDNMKESMEHIVDQMDAVLDLRKAHKDLLTELRQENRELEKQYKIAQDEAAHPGLTEAEHELLFSSEDYKRLTGMLQDISKQADALYEEYKNKIASVTEDETYAISYITDEYERQLGLLESQYEIAKQQLAVEKARQELQNTLRERNTAVLINGAWTWMADPDAVQAAMEKVADAEVELEDAITDSEFNKETAEIETARDAIKSSIDAMEALEFAIEDLADGIVDLADSINENIFNAIGTTSRNYLKQTEGHGLELFMDELTELQETSGLVFSNTDVEKLYSLLSSGNTINSSNIFDDSIVHDSAAIASILSNTTNTNGGNTQTIIINGITLSDADSEMLLNALERVSYTWQA